MASGLVTFGEMEEQLLKLRDAGVLSYRELFDGRAGQVEFAAADTPRIVELMRKLTKDGPHWRQGRPRAGRLCVRCFTHDRDAGRGILRDEDFPR